MNRNDALLGQMGSIEVEKKTGSLCLTHDNQIIEIYFRNGLIGAISSNMDGQQLGQHLLKEGYIDSRKLCSLLKKSLRKKTALGETAVQQKILAPWELHEVIKRQALELLKRCSANGFQIRSFEARSKSFKFPVHVDLGWLLLELAREKSQSLADDFSGQIALKERKDLSFLPWSPEEISVLSQLNNPRTLKELVSRTGIEESQVRKIVGICRDFEVIEVHRSVSDQAPAPQPEASFSLDLLIPRVKNPVYSDKLEIVKNELSFASEQFRSLKVRINEVRRSKPTQAISISSPHPGDGKSLISCNLAFCFARDPGHRVILLDCDFRIPSLHTYLGISLEPGVVGYLRDKQLQPYCFVRRVGNLYVMTAGGVADDPVELLSLDKMRELINSLKREFDTVILDSPPIQPVPDARILSDLADGTVMVIRRGKTPYKGVEKALKCINPKKFVGVVFNDVKPLMFHTYYDYKYYHYGKQTYYGYNQRGREDRQSKDSGSRHSIS